MRKNFKESIDLKQL